MAPKSRSRQDAFNKAIHCQAHVHLKQVFLPQVIELLEDRCSASIGENPEIVKIGYPAAFPSDYLRPDIQLEGGPLASWIPNAEYEIRPHAAEAFPDVLAQPICRVRAIKAERTFWEKVTLLHHEAHRPEGSLQPRGYSRDYYDVSRMAQSPLRDTAMKDLDLLRHVVAFEDAINHLNV
jgi:hypothetical protein